MSRFFNYERAASALVDAIFEGTKKLPKSGMSVLEVLRSGEVA